MKRLFLLFFLCAGPAFGATFTATTCNVADVITAIGLASNGDTVIIPNGSCSWSSGLTTTKQIFILGQAAGSVIITDADTTSTDSLITMTTGTSFHITVANINFLAGTGTGTYVTFNDGSGTPLVPLMHNMSMEDPNAQLVHVVQWNTVGGVFWSNAVYSNTGSGGGCGAQIGSDSGSLVVKSGLNWDTASTMGTLDVGEVTNLYIEDNTFTNIGQMPDTDDNGRVVVRHNTYIGSWGLTHGTTSLFGGRQFEIYSNAFQYPNANRNMNRYFWSRAGAGLVWSNTFDWINGGCYPNKSTFVWTVENAQGSAGGHGCVTGWMGFHQSGSGGSGTTQSPSYIGTGNPSQSTEPNQIPAPFYIFNNSGTGAGITHYGENDGQNGVCGNTNPATGNLFQATDFNKMNRDFYTDDSTTGGFIPASSPNLEPIGVGLFSARPTTGFTGDGYFATDTNTLYTIGQVLGDGWNYTPIAIENPISQGSEWINGAVTSIDFGNVQTSTTQNLMYGTVESAGCPSTPTDCNDSTAVLKGSWTSDQEAQAQVVTQTPGTECCKEVELRLNTTITSHSITGYELNCSTSNENYMELVRWNGALGNFTSLNSVSTNCSTGDVMMLKRVGGTLSAYKNGTLMFTQSDSTYTAGSPGVGFFNNFDTHFTDSGLTNFKAASLGTNAAQWSATYTPAAYPNPLRAGLPQAATPVCTSNCGGTYSSTVNVTVTESSSGAIMCYRTDGVTPSIGGSASCPALSTLVTAPVVISASGPLIVVGGGTGYVDSVPLSLTFTINPIIKTSAPGAPFLAKVVAN